MCRQLPDLPQATADAGENLQHMTCSIQHACKMSHIRAMASSCNLRGCACSTHERWVARPAILPWCTLSARHLGPGHRLSRTTAAAQCRCRPPQQLLHLSSCCIGLVAALALRIQMVSQQPCCHAVLCHFQNRCSPGNSDLLHHLLLL